VAQRKQKPPQRHRVTRSQRRRGAQLRRGWEEAAASERLRPTDA